MSTRETIAILNEDQTVTGIYCHSDNGFWHTGPILLNHYTDESKIRQLIELGDLSSIHPNIHPTESWHSFKNRENGVCVFYGRDRGEKDISSRTCNSWEEYLGCQGQEYNYLFIPGSGWVVEYYGDRSDLTDAVAAYNSQCENT